MRAFPGGRKMCRREPLAFKTLARNRCRNSYNMEGGKFFFGREIPKSSGKTSRGILQSGKSGGGREGRSTREIHPQRKRGEGSP